jgi:hypothetical protein
MMIDIESECAVEWNSKIYEFLSAYGNWCTPDADSDVVINKEEILLKIAFLFSGYETKN